MTPSGRILITGGTGSLGTAILERARREGWPAEFIVYSRDEVKQAATAERFPGIRLILGDVQDAGMLRRAMRDVDTVIHAAAYKRVPEAERETVACVQANVDGSVRVASAALDARVRKVVGISTDKACHPINAYGQSKALMERLFQSFARLESETGYHLVRYGNVLASRGSVLPALLSQVAKGDPITLTDPAMTRFWLTLDDAVDLVLAAMGTEPGEVLIPACRAASMATVAEAIAPGHPVVVIGTRGGEKRHEALIHEVEAPYAREYGPGWAVRSLAVAPRNELPEGFHYLSNEAQQLTVKEFRALVAAITEGRTVRTLR